MPTPSEQNVETFFRLYLRWFKLQQALELCNEVAAQVLEESAVVQKKKYTIKDSNGDPIPDLAVTCRVHNGAEHWDVPMHTEPDGSLFAPVGGVLDYDSIGYQQIHVEPADTVDADLTFVANS